jgi:hypothetical protein
MTEREIWELLLRLQSFGGATIRPLLDSTLPAGEQIELDWVGQAQRFSIETIRTGTPKEVENVIARSSSRDAGPRLVVAPYLSEQAVRLLADAGLSAVDLCGNGLVTVPGRWAIERRVSKNRFTETTPIKNIYKGTSSLVPRVFLAEREYPSVSAVYDAIVKRGGAITMPTVSKALKALEDGLLLRKAETLRVPDPRRLFEALAGNYRPPEPKRRLKGCVSSLAEWRRRALDRARAEGRQIAGFAPERYAVFPSSYEELRVYTEDLDAVARLTDLDEDAPWPNIEIVETREPTVYFDLREEDGFLWCPPLEVALDLRTRDKRSRETAEAIEDGIVRGLVSTGGRA